MRISYSVSVHEPIADRRLIVICAWCRAILTPPLDEAADMKAADFTHTICPRCVMRWFDVRIRQPL